MQREGSLHLGKLQRILFGISPDATRFERRGFRGGDPVARQRFETIGATFVAGYHAGLETGPSEQLVARLEAVEPERRGFAYEGAGMALLLLDTLLPWRRDRWQTFLAGAGSRHAYMVHIGAGWAMARAGRSFERATRRMDQRLRWLVLDGWGFHDGYFSARRCIEQHVVPARIVAGYQRRAWDQGLGRALWFVECAGVAGVTASIERFDAARHADLWSGVGLAAAYAGGADDAALENLRRAAGEHRSALAQGAAFAAQARERAGNATPHTERACLTLCGLGAKAAAQCTDEAFRDLPPDGSEPAYEAWRGRLRMRFAPVAVQS